MIDGLRVSFIMDGKRYYYEFGTHVKSDKYYQVKKTKEEILKAKQDLLDLLNSGL